MKNWISKRYTFGHISLVIEQIGHVSLVIEQKLIYPNQSKILETTCMTDSDFYF